MTSRPAPLTYKADGAAGRRRPSASGSAGLADGAAGACAVSAPSRARSQPGRTCAGGRRGAAAAPRGKGPRAGGGRRRAPAAPAAGGSRRRAGPRAPRGSPHTEAPREGGSDGGRGRPGRRSRAWGALASRAAHRAPGRASARDGCRGGGGAGWGAGSRGPARAGGGLARPLPHNGAAPRAPRTVPGAAAGGCGVVAARAGPRPGLGERGPAVGSVAHPAGSSVPLPLPGTGRPERPIAAPLAERGRPLGTARADVCVFMCESQPPRGARP